MKGLLELDPTKRLSGDNVFKHKYFSIFMKNNNTNSNSNNNANNNVINVNNNLNNSNSATNIKGNKDEKNIIINKVNNNINLNKINLKNSNPDISPFQNNSNRNEHIQNKINIINKNSISKDKDKDKEDINSKKSEKDKMPESNNTNKENNNSINNINPKISIKIKEKEKPKKDIESKPINVTPSKVINNTTNINIINYNCYNNATNRNSNLQIQKKILDFAQNQKSQFKSFTNHDLLENNLINISKPKEVIINQINNSNNLTILNGSESLYAHKNNFNIKKKLNNFTKSMMNFNSIKKLTLINKPSKKSTSVKIIENENNNNNSNIDLSLKLPQSISGISLSQGKADKKKINKDKDKNIIKQANNTFYNFNLNVIQNNNNTNNILNSNNSLNSYKGSNTNTNFGSLLSKAYSTNGFKSFFSNKDNKYNYKLNTNYIKEENKKYLYNNSFNDKNIIDEKDELDISDNNIYDYNQKSYSKKKEKKKLLIPFGSENLDVYNKNRMGYGTFYNKNFMFGFKKKDKMKKYNNNNKLPKLYKSISNATQYNYFVNNKIKKNNSNIYMIGKKAFNPYNYDYSNKLKYYNPKFLV